jgi:hypothetical protein
MLSGKHEGSDMLIHDDADMATVVRETIAALDESARHIGKADRSITAEEIGEIEASMKRLQDGLDFKKRANSAARA